MRRPFDVIGGRLNGVTQVSQADGDDIPPLPPLSAYDGEDSRSSGRRKPNEFVEMNDEDRAAIEPFPFRPWGSRDLSAIPVPEIVYSDFYARGYTSVTLAAPKVGKSMLGLAEAIDMASGRGILTGRVQEPLRVVYYNAEDDQNAIDARVAALLTLYGLEQSEIGDTFYPHSGVEEDAFYLVSGQDPVINEPLFVALEKFCSAAQADVLIFDPLQDLTRSPETNDVFRALGQRLRRMASSCHVAIGLVHHTRKVAPGAAPSIDDMRGGSALRGSARFNRILISMSEDEAVRASVPNHRHFFRIGDVESNLAPPSAEVNRWFEKVSVETPNGARVGAVRSWKWPDAFSGISTADARRVQIEVAALADNPPRKDSQSADWVGHIVARVLNLDSSDDGDRNRIKDLLKTWVKTGVLAITQVRDQRRGRDVSVVVSGTNILDGGGDA